MDEWHIVSLPAKALNRKWWQFWRPRIVLARFRRQFHHKPFSHVTFERLGD